MCDLLAPWGLLLLTICVVFCLIMRWWKSGVGLLALVLVVNWYWQVVALEFDTLDEQKKPNHLRVLTWNICCVDSTGTDDADGLLSLILGQNADVVFLTEYGETYMPKIDSAMCAHYPHKGSIENWLTYSNVYSSVTIDSCKQLFEGENGVLLRYDLKAAESSLRLYCVHLQSNNLVNGGMFYPDSIQSKEGVSQYLENYETAANIRHGQAKLEVGDFDNVPTIVMGDMNDVAGSPCMRVFKGAGLRDAWWNAGFGYGAAIHEPLPYRIDHILYSNRLRLKGIKKVDANGLSDHDALVADFEMR